MKIQKMTNPFKSYLNTYFETLTDFKHTSNRLNKVLLKDVQTYTSEGASYFSGTALIIGDWSGPTDNGWKINFHTGVLKSTHKENYSSEINLVLSREFGLAFAQCFEALERFMKNIVREKGKFDPSFKILQSGKKFSDGNYLRGGDAVFELVKKAGGSRFKEYSQTNSQNFKFKETFTILAEVRHAITHSQGQLNVNKLSINEYYKTLFAFLFPLNELRGEVILMKFDYNTLDRLLIILAEFGFQMFKTFSEVENHDWKI